jgi:hypothetical protein
MQEIRLALLLLIIGSGPLPAGEVNHSGVTYQAGVYSLEFDVVIEAELDTVRGYVTDYANLDQLSELIIESELLEPPATDSKRRLLVVRPCILFLCRNLRVVEDITEVRPDQIVATVVPALCDFKSGETRWQLAAADSRHTRIEFQGSVEPGFWVPPLLGPALVKRRLLKEAMQIIQNIEYRSVHD